MKVAIIGKKNNAGLEKDSRILTDILKNSGAEVIFRNVDKFRPIDNSVDICLFTEVVDPRYMGRKNILIPNQEWFFRVWTSELHKFDAIFCKSRLATELFRPHHPRVIYTGFTSIDCYNGEEKILECFHSQGKSRAKGTNFVMKAWEDPTLPPIHVITKKRKSPGNNLLLYNKRLPQAAYTQLMNRCLIHVYPSQIEGFGHCLNEARSCGAVVITTNLPPMNELISRYLVPTDKIMRLADRLGFCATVDPLVLRETVKKVVLKKQLEETGKKNRIDFLKNDLRFKEKFLYELRRI